MAQTALQKKNAEEKRAATKAAREAAAAEQAADLKASFEAACKDPGHESGLHDDPVWNPGHPLYQAVNALIDAGLLPAAAIEEAKKGQGTNLPEAAPESDLDALAAWLAEQTWSEFAVSLASQYAKKGFLSPKQEAAAISMRDKVQATQKRKAEAKVAAASDIDLTDLPSGYYAIPGGDTRLKVRVARPTKASQWFGWTFVSDGAEYGSRKTYGKQGPEGTYQGAIQAELRAILADPAGAQAAYGKLWGVCGSCGRLLEDEASIAAGIGPICAQKWAS